MQLTATKSTPKPKILCVTPSHQPILHCSRLQVLISFHWYCNRFPGQTAENLSRYYKKSKESVKSLSDFSKVITGNTASQAPPIVLPLAITVTQENKSLMSSTKEHTQIRLFYATVFPLVYVCGFCGVFFVCVCVCVCVCFLLGVLSSDPAHQPHQSSQRI